MCIIYTVYKKTNNKKKTLFSSCSSYSNAKSHHVKNLTNRKTNRSQILWLAGAWPGVNAIAYLVSECIKANSIDLSCQNGNLSMTAVTYDDKNKI